MTRKELLGWLAIFALLTLFSSGRWALAPVAWIVPVLGCSSCIVTSTVRGVFLLLAAIYSRRALPGMERFRSLSDLSDLHALQRTDCDVALPHRSAASHHAWYRAATTLVFPLAATAIEFVIMADGPLGSFGAQAYTQSAFAPLAQFASVGGLWGITFVVSWFASVAHWAVSRYEAGQPVSRGCRDVRRGLRRNPLLWRSVCSARRSRSSA